MAQMQPADTGADGNHPIYSQFVFKDQARATPVARPRSDHRR